MSLNCSFLLVNNLNISVMEIRKFLEINPVNPEYQRNPNKGKSLQKIADSMTKYGNLSLPVCVKQVLKNGTERYVLVDGLHRVEAARLAKKLAV